MEKKILVKKNEGKWERIPIKSGDREHFVAQVQAYRENVGMQQFRVGVIELEPGQMVGEHKHNCDEILYVLEGQGTFVVDGKEYEAGVGDSVYVAPNVIHGNHKNAGDKTLRYLFISGQEIAPLEEKHLHLVSGKFVTPQPMKSAKDFSK